MNKVIIKRNTWLQRVEQARGRIKEQQLRVNAFNERWSFNPLFGESNHWEDEEIQWHRWSHILQRPVYSQRNLPWRQVVLAYMVLLNPLQPQLKPLSYGAPYLLSLCLSGSLCLLLFLLGLTLHFDFQSFHLWPTSTCSFSLNYILVAGQYFLFFAHVPWAEHFSILQ